ncbi:Cytochrome c oxidase subunit 6B [Stygiomarasmius scandens]|uniref:Cytochrome c oxidase subunit n=1 Tax=Marasmiellus scandens TaxID=2682957 RepID=A0ABR1J9M9_9AGAR
MSDAETNDLSSKYVLRTVGFDARFPNQNQTRNCFQNYTDYFKCIAAKGEDYAPCVQFKRAYHSLCPNEWISKWDDQRENGTFPASLEP